MTAVEAIDFVRSKRSVISPNLGFRSQLDTYEEQLYEAGFKERVLPASAPGLPGPLGPASKACSIQACEQARLSKLACVIASMTHASTSSRGNP